MEADLPQARSPVPCARMKDGVILRVSKPARMGIDDSGLNALRPPTHDEKQACFEIGCYENGTRGSLARPFPARNTFAMLLAARLAFGAVTKSKRVTKSAVTKMGRARVLLHCCVLWMCAETNFSHPIPDSSR